MNIRPIAEIGAIALVGVAVFGWTFSQPPAPDQLKSKKSARQPVTVSQVGKRGDKIPAVVQLSPRQLKISPDPVALQTPDQALRSGGDLYQVIPANLKLRAGPSSTTQLLNVYSRGATFEKIGQQGGWLQVRSTEDGASGWMFSDYLQAAN
ncbi:MAG: SH3 domain-containing protein [Hyphomicrobiales bacterium]|nr:SH3 domain-containing protein [Hyphomicrobiales bacterium]